MSDGLTEMEMAADREAEAARLASGWMPIESAPRDGSTIIITDGKNSYPATYGKGDGVDCQFAWGIIDGDGDYNAVMDEVITHWMPLPAAPGEIA